MISYSQDLTVAWGECDPFGLVYYPAMFTWFNETEHALLRRIGFGTRALIEADRTAFVMGDVQFRFVGPASYGDRIRTTMTLARIGGATLHWDCKAIHVDTGAPVTEGRQVRIHAQVQEDGTLSAKPIPAAIRAALSQPTVPAATEESAQ